MKICHSIEDNLHNNLESLTTDDVSNQIKNYDNLIEQIDFTFPSNIQNKVKNLYKGKKQLPAILNGDIDGFIVENSSIIQTASQINTVTIP